MAIESHLTLRGYFENLTEGARNLAPTELINSDAPTTVTVVSLVSGDNTIAVPAKAVGCLILFASTSAVVKKLKGAGGDTGITLHPTKWLVLSFTAAAMANIIINASANDTGLYTEFLFF